MSRQDLYSTTINGTLYEMNMLDPDVSETLFRRVAQKLSASVGMAFDVAMGNKKSIYDSHNLGEALLAIELPVDFLKDLFRDLTSVLDDATMKDLKEAFISVTQIQPPGEQYKGTVPLSRLYKLHYRGNIGELYKWLAWGAKIQWGKSLLGSFGEEIGNLSATMKNVARTERAEEKSQSPNLSVG